MVEIDKPRIECIDSPEDPAHGIFIVEPLERGYGTTLGNSLRRILLSSLPGTAATSIKIAGVQHEFSTIPGVKEDVTEIVLNIKRIIFKMNCDGVKTVYIDASGECEVTAGDIKTDDDVEILNKDLHICSLGPDAMLNMEITMSRGRGYVPADRNKTPQTPIGVIPVDSLYSPVYKVNYTVENTRVGNMTDFDKLTLSATPIPRTLNMAMSGIRDMSILAEPPQDRYPVQTYVMEYNPGVLMQAMSRELKRGGQVYYLHNRVETIEFTASRIRQMLPQAEVAVAHGKMSEEELSEIWRKLVENEIQILVCTTIIETGVDVPNVNTMIIEDADRFGLSQLYQLRGRVGRSNRRGYAYFTFRREKVLTEVASKRLSAMREFTQFGSGFHIAMRDLEIRGAGSILGGRQHGHMEAVGYDMYLKLLSEAVAEERGEPIQKTSECVVDLQIDAHIPERYIESLAQRLDIYRKIAAIQSEEDRLDIMDELIDRYGDPPQAVIGLLSVSMLRNCAAQLGITEITQRNGRLLFYTEHPTQEEILALSAAFRGRVLFNSIGKPYIGVQLQAGEDPLELMRKTVQIMQQAAAEAAPSDTNSVK